MDTKINFSQIPYNYPICLNQECSKAATCLRRLVEQSMPTDLSYWPFISPKHLATHKGDCPHYRQATKVRHAKGFTQILENLPHNQMQKVVSNLIAYFGRTVYYRFRKGEHLLSPSEQQKVLSIILVYCKKSQILDFDAYVDGFNW